MVEPSKISYYLSLIGGSFTILTGTIPLITYFGLGQSGYLFGGAPLFSS